jgi:hypothetical protein
MIRESFLPVAALTIITTAGCSETGGQLRSEAAPQRETRVTIADPIPGAISGLPFSNDRAFSTLDEYLAFLEEAGAYDTPFWKETKPGSQVYYLVTRMRPGQKPDMATRAELMKRYGFTR